MRSLAMDEFVERVRESSDIVNVVSAYVPLKKKGGRYWGCCPFHKEKTPSFAVNPDKGLFYCFGCHQGGNAFKFISLAENVSYFEAIKLLAERLGIPLPEREKTPEEQRRDDHFKKLRDVLSLARDYFHSCLVNTKFGAAGRDYWAGRGIGGEIIREFSLGFSPNSYDKFHRDFKKRGIGDDLLLEAGLVKQGERGGVYDRFRNRVMIPIADERGRIVAFGGRVMDGGEPKYLNSPETALFNKRRLLFGLDRAARAIRAANRVIIVEGYMDAISLFAAGIRNVVASLGTAFTLEQCRLALRYAPEIYFCYDSDAAGQKATMRALAILKDTAAKAHVLVVPDGKDPDEYVRKHGSAAFGELVKNARPIADYQINYLLNQSSLASGAGRGEALERVAPVLLSLKKDALAYNRYVRYVADRLAIEEGLIAQTVARAKPLEAETVYQPRRFASNINSGVRMTPNDGQPAGGAGNNFAASAADGNSPAPPKREPPVEAAIRQAGLVILRQIWQDAGALPYLAAALDLAAYPDAAVRGILEIFLAQSEGGQPLNESALDENQAALLSQAVLSAVPGEDLIAQFDACIAVIKRAGLKNKYEEVRLMAADLEQKGDTAAALAKLGEAQRLKTEMDALDQEMKITIA